MTRNVCLIEPWYGGSHKVWADTWINNSAHNISLLSLPGCHWRWRMRAGSVELARRYNEHVEKFGRPDLVIVSALTDVSSFAGLARRSLDGVGLAVYFHETQSAYPDAKGRPRSDEMILANWRSAEVADVIWFNSEFHRDVFITWLPGVFARQPQQHPRPSQLAAKSRVLYPPVETELIASRRKNRKSATNSANGGPVRVIYNQRWDHDKNPHSVISALAEMIEKGHELEIVLAGEDQGHSDVFSSALERLGTAVVSSGWLERDDYLDALVSADIVLSAAEHEFFGIAIVEALAAGCVAVLPNQLSYPELVGKQWADTALYGPGELRKRLEYVLNNFTKVRLSHEGLTESMARFDSKVSIAAHDAAVEEAIQLVSSTM